jgi:hypothetical protein
MYWREGKDKKGLDGGRGEENNRTVIIYKRKREEKRVK